MKSFQLGGGGFLFCPAGSASSAWRHPPTPQPLCPPISHSPFSSPDSSGQPYPLCPPTPEPCATAGWGSWGWDLVLVTNHIARDYQPAVSPTSIHRPSIRPSIHPPGPHLPRTPRSPAREQGLAACEQSSSQSCSQWLSSAPGTPTLRPPCPSPVPAACCPLGSLRALPSGPTELKQLVSADWLSSAGTAVKPP